MIRRRWRSQGFFRVASLTGGVRQLICQVSMTVDPAAASTSGAQATCLNSPYSGAIEVLAEQGAYCGTSEVIITFDPALADPDCCTITVDGLRITYGQPSMVEFPVRTLVGDVNLDGGIAASDVGDVTARMGNVAPACP